MKNGEIVIKEKHSSESILDELLLRSELGQDKIFKLAKNLDEIKSLKEKQLKTNK